jgi:hypothetical protein
LLIVVYSVLLALLTGSGAFVCRALLRGRRLGMFVSLSAGVSLLHGLVLLGLPVVVVLGALAAMALAEGAVRWRGRGSWPTLHRRDVLWVAVIFASTLPLWAYTTFRPLWAFDARNVWFFAGRIIFAEGHFPIDAFHRLICHWGPDYRLNMNADYPKLIGVLTASAATLAGYWNEYVPKVGILIVHTLWLIGLIELGWRARAVVVNLLLMGITKYRYFFDSASIDIHVAMFTMIGILALLRAGEERERGGDGADRFVAVALAAIAVSSQLKYEGRALAVIILGAALVARVVRWRELRRALPMFLLFLPTAIWLVEVRLFDVPSYLRHSGGISAALTRLHTDLFSHILPGIAWDPLTIAGAVALIVGLAAAKIATPSLPLSTWLRSSPVRLGALVSAGYTGALVAVYLVTPYTTVLEHMKTSIERATLPIEVALVAAAIAVVERAWRVGRAGRVVTAPSPGA